MSGALHWSSTTGDLTKVTYPVSSTVFEYSYDNLGRLKEIALDGTTDKPMARYWYEGPGARVVQRDQGVDLAVGSNYLQRKTIAYDALQRPTDIDHTRVQPSTMSSTALRSLDYGCHCRPGIDPPVAGNRLTGIQARSLERLRPSCGAPGTFETLRRGSRAAIVSIVIEAVELAPGSGIAATRSSNPPRYSPPPDGVSTLTLSAPHSPPTDCARCGSSDKPPRIARPWIWTSGGSTPFVITRIGALPKLPPIFASSRPILLLLAIDQQFAEHARQAGWSRCRGQPSIHHPVGSG
jgi:hypothetical protein